MGGFLLRTSQAWYQVFQLARELNCREIRRIMACEQSDCDLRNKFLPKTKQKTRQISISNSPILSSSVSLVLPYRYAIELTELLYFRTVLRVVIGLTAGSTVKQPPRAKGRSTWCIGQHQYLRLLRDTVFTLGLCRGYYLMVLHCPS